MAKKPSGEDLFANSTMTFGEHLEELRTCLTRAIFGLIVGTIVGLFLADSVVAWIESPVLAGLKRYMVEASQAQLTKKYGDDKDIFGLMKVLDDHIMVIEEVYVEREQLARLQAEVGTSGTNDATTGKSPPVAEVVDTKLSPPSTNLVKTRIWRQAEAKISSLNPYETFMIYLKASLVTGVVVASPYIFYQIWMFVAAGLYPNERNYVFVFLPISLGLFLGGGMLAFFFVLGPVLDFLFSYNQAMNISPDMRISDIISFVLMLPLGFGLSFQLPLVMFFIHRLGIVSFEAFLDKWRIAVLAIAVTSMVLTPSGDPISMLMMFVPLTILYFLGLAMIKWMPHGRSQFETPKV